MKSLLHIASLALGLIGNLWDKNPLDSLVLLNTTEQKIEYRVKWSTTKLVLTQGDLITQHVDAIVNPANVRLMNFGGVALAINNAAGPSLQAHIDSLPCNADGKYLKVGQALVTDAFNLTNNGIQHIVHAVGPDTRRTWQAASKEKLLARTYISILEEAAKHDEITTIALPSISTGIFGYDVNEASPIALNQVISWIKNHPLRFKEVRFVLWPDNFNVYKNILNTSK